MVMPKPDLLPGVQRTQPPRRVVCRSRRIITLAKLRAAMRDGAQLLLLGSVDWFFAHWQFARFPLLDRTDSLRLLLIINSAALAHVILVRLLPHLRARRIAKTWSSNERQRVFSGHAASAMSRFSRTMTKR
jgi:hypothetical protein